MSRVHCLDCGTFVVVDPSGVCPEGHQVGASGARVANAIGSDVPFPDEPEPWVARVELSDEPVAEPVARTIRPVSLPGAQAAPTEQDAPVDSDELLRELHSLSDLTSSDNGQPTPAPHRVPPPASARPATPAAPVRPHTPPTPTRATPAAAPAPVATPATNGTDPSVRAASASPAPPAAPSASPPPTVSARPSASPTPSARPTAAPRPLVDDEVAGLTALEAAVHALGLSDTGTTDGGEHGGNDLQAPVPPASPPAPDHIDLVSTDGHGPDATHRPSPTNGQAPVIKPDPARARDDAGTLAELESLFSAPSALPEPPALLRPTPDAPAAAPQPATPPGTTGGAPAPAAPSDGDEPVTRWSVLADVAALADSSPEPDDAAGDEPAGEPTDEPASGIDLGNFTARGRRVGRREAAKRQRRRRG